METKDKTMVPSARRILKFPWRYPAIIPLVTIVTTALGTGLAYIYYSLATKPDIRRTRGQEISFTTVEPTTCNQLNNPSPKKEDPALVEIREKLNRA